MHVAVAGLGWKCSPGLLPEGPAEPVKFPQYASISFNSMPLIKLFPLPGTPSTFLWVGKPIFCNTLLKLMPPG